ncbi:unnamed protein product [Gadus morhua 'NCC']
MRWGASSLENSLEKQFPSRRPRLMCSGARRLVVLDAQDVIRRHQHRRNAGKGILAIATAFHWQRTRGAFVEETELLEFNTGCGLETIAMKVSILLF